MSVVIGNAQDVGSRDRQEDYLSSKKIGDMDVAILADGMGGYEGGDQASLTVTQAFISFIEQQARKYPLIPDLLVDAAYSANAQLAQLKQNAQSNMGSTLVAVLVRGNHAWWVSIGDSLLYLWRDGRLQKLNADHSHYQDLRQKVFLGQLSSAQAASDPERDGLTSALMGREMKHVDISRFGIELKDGDTFLLASDGLETLSAEQIQATLHRVSAPQQLSDTLVQQVIRANREHQDNVSVLIVGISSCEMSRVVPAPTTSRNRIRNFLFPATMLLAGGIFGLSLSMLLQNPTPENPVPPSPPTSSLSGQSEANESVKSVSHPENCETALINFDKEICKKIPEKDRESDIEKSCRLISDSEKTNKLCDKINPVEESKTERLGVEEHKQKCQLSQPDCPKDSTTKDNVEAPVPAPAPSASAPTTTSTRAPAAPAAPADEDGFLNWLWKLLGFK